jgi:uncharacterized membrane protein SpoIIM required for sporulation
MSGHQTVMFLFEKDGKPPDLRLGPLFLQSVAFAGFGITAGILLFPAEASLVGVFLIALGQARTVHALLDRNRDEIWGKLCSPREANLRLAVAQGVIFAGVLVAYGAAALVLPEARALEALARQVGDYGGRSLADVRFDGVGVVLGHNLVVALVGFLFALLYRHGGLLLVLAWNASVWGAVFPWLARTAPDAGAGGTLVYLAKTLAAILPHLAPEAAAYVLVATAGVFLSKTVARYEWGEPRFKQAAGASARLLGLGLALLAGASLVEAFVTPALVALLF